MALETVDLVYTTGEYLYFRVVRSADGKVLDFADNTFKTLATTATMHAQMTEVASVGGGESLFSASLDLADINDTMTPVLVSVVVYLREGGSIVLADDEHLSESSLTVVNGELLQVLGSEQIYTVDLTTNYTTTLGTSMHFTAELKRRDGRSVDLATVDPAATCEIEVTMDADATEGERVAVFSLDTTDCGAVNTDSQFEVEYADPGLTSNRGFKAKAIITTGGVAYEGDAKFNT